MHPLESERSLAHSPPPPSVPCVTPTPTPITIGCSAVQVYMSTVRAVAPTTLLAPATQSVTVDNTGGVLDITANLTVEAWVKVGFAPRVRLPRRAMPPFLGSRMPANHTHSLTPSLTPPLTPSLTHSHFAIVAGTCSSPTRDAHVFDDSDKEWSHWCQRRHICALSALSPRQIWCARHGGHTQAQRVGVSEWSE